MSTIRKFYLRDVRCFEGEHTFNIRPITFLIGENSTGKSTVLGCLQALGTFSQYGYRIPSYEIDFNSEPYQMGSFADIVRRSRPKKEDFQLGFEYKIGGKRIKRYLTLTESSKGSEPTVCSAKWVFDEGEIVFFIDERHQGKEKDPFKVTYGLNQSEFRVSINMDRYHWPWLNLTGVYSYLSDPPEDLNDVAKNLLQFIDRQFPRSEKRRYGRSGSSRFFREFGFGMPIIHSIAPIRSKPKRTYDPLKGEETPEGSEIPMVLMNLSTSSKRTWETLRMRLLHFGKASGLFSDIKIRKLGRSKSKSDPFQLQIKVRGPKTNLIDVGYGVSQVLPILVRVLTTRNAKFLLQQPEVHLHPKGQAELTSLLVEIYKRNRNSFVIETHSDYMIDRVRIEIMKGNIKPSDVSLIYLNPIGNKVKTHNISFDAQANMIDVPVGYRDFFLSESRNLLFISD